VIAVADASPLIILAKLDCFDLLSKFYSPLYVSAEVYHEVAVVGAGLPGAQEVATSAWVQVLQIQNRAALREAQSKYALGIGELSTILLGKELQANVALLDDFEARELARQEGLQVRGAVGLIEAFYLKGHLVDIRRAFQQLLNNNAYVDRRLLNRRLQFLGVPPL